MQLTFLGAAGTVTGSRYLLEAGAGPILVDCGLFQGYKQLRLRNWARFPLDPAALRAIILTHAHIDHTGYLPVLCRDGFNGPIYCSQGTADLAALLLPDSAHIQEEDAAFANRHGFSKHHPALPLYTQDDVRKSLRQFVPVERDQTFNPVAGLSCRLRRAGHLLGASFVEIRGGDVSITFSGDLGRPDDIVLRAPDPPSQTDYVVIESTYGDRKHSAIDPEQELGQRLAPACERGGVTVIPAFSVGRAQALLLMIARLKSKGALAGVPVYLDSPLAVDATAIYGRWSHDHRLTRAEIGAMCQVASLVNTPEQSQALDRRGGPMIIVSASGMATGGRVLHHLKAFLGDPQNLVLLAGYQTPGTRGAALVGGAATLRIHGMDHPVRAQVGQLTASSSHADADELLAWLRQIRKPPRCTFITHGDPHASDALRCRIERELGWVARVPEQRDTFDLRIL